MAFVIGDSCIGCGSCAGSCPLGAISENGGVFVIGGSQCISCGIYTALLTRSHHNRMRGVKHVHLIKSLLRPKLLIYSDNRISYDYWQKRQISVRAHYTKKHRQYEEYQVEICKYIRLDDLPHCFLCCYICMIGKPCLRPFTNLRHGKPRGGRLHIYIIQIKHLFFRNPHADFIWNITTHPANFYANNINFFIRTSYLPFIIDAFG